MRVWPGQQTLAHFAVANFPAVVALVAECLLAAVAVLVVGGSFPVARWVAMAALSEVAREVHRVCRTCLGAFCGQREAVGQMRTNAGDAPG